MVLIPETSIHVAVALMERAEATQEDARRPHLGASELGEECVRKIWSKFHWLADGRRDGRMIRLLRRGKVEETLMLQDLADLGYEIIPGKDLQVAAFGGHLGGTPDAGILGIPAAPKTKHILELKTSNDANQKKLIKLGVEEAHPEHYVQIQVYMALNGFERALYLSINKNDDTIYEERVPLNRVAAQRYLDRAQRVIERQSLPERISEDPEWYQCRMCQYHANCFERAMPARSCRTCLHVTAEIEGTGGWWCGKHQKALTVDEQKAGCEHQRFLPSILHWMEQVDATNEAVIYRREDGTRWEDRGPNA